MNKMVMVGFVLAACWTTITQARGKDGPKSPAPIPAVKLLRQAPDPFGHPRPTPDSKDVPVRTSLYFALGMVNKKPGDDVSPATLAVTLEAAGKKPVQVLSPGSRFEHGFSGEIQSVGKRATRRGPSVTVYIQPDEPLDPLTTYTVRVTARSFQGVTFAQSWIPQDHWSFTTAAATQKRDLRFDLDLTARPVQWQGLLFGGFCKVGFCDSAKGLEPSYELMARDRAKYPNAWVLKRDFWLTATDHTAGFFESSAPNIVRELETRRVAAITTTSQGCLLKVEDFFGHQQYGIPSGRPLSEDYQKGFEILIADGKHYARAKVIAVDDAASTVLVGRFEMPAGGFVIDDPSQNRVANAKTPGRFPNGGCYLRRFAPTGTPRYYWKRLDQEWDISRRFHQRVMANFADAPGDLSDKGQTWCPAKDYAELHEVTRTITNHIIERYGVEASLTYVWSIFNEPDLSSYFWHGTREELDKFYDYSVDAILRAFEDHGADSAKVFIGGLELGAVAPNLPWLNPFLQHCSPNGTAATSLNAAYADARLDGKRSRRVESLCRAHGGKGAPLDFVSIHTYNSSAVATGKLKLAKDKALAVDPQYYEKLWICSHESTPDWVPKPDLAFRDVYLGNGYYPAWCADFVWRQLRQGQRDPRYAMGDTILTFWPWPVGLSSVGVATQTVRVDDDGDGKSDRAATLPTPIYNFLNLLGSLGGDYWVLSEQIAAAHTVAGFAGRGRAGELRVLFYAHDPADLQARAEQEFQVNLSVKGLTGGQVRVEQYRFDRHHHSYYELAKKIQARRDHSVLSADEFRALESLVNLIPEKEVVIQPGADGRLLVPATLAGNGATFLVIHAAIPVRSPGR